MTVITATRAEAAGAGFDAAGVLNSDGSRAEAAAYGFPALVHGAAPLASAAPDALRLEIVTADGTQLVNDLTTRRNLTFTVEHNGSGTINFETDLDSLPASVDLDDPDNLVRVHYGDLPSWPFGVAEGYIAAAPPTKGEAGWSASVVANGSWDVLDFGVLWPPSGATGDTREFSYTAGMTGPSYVPAQWRKPAGRNVRTSWRWKHRWPRGWPEKKAQWVWPTSPEKGSPNRTVHFICTPFTLTQTRDVEINAAGDDNLKLYLNGARIKRKGRGAWHKRTRLVRRLRAGTYTLAAAVANLPGGNNSSGFICAVARLNSSGQRVEWLHRSSPMTVQYKVADGYIAQVPLPPVGWYPPDVLRQHVVEAAARGVDFHAAMTVTFTSKADSNGSAWTTKGPVEYDIMTTGTALGEKVRSLGYDVAMLPGLRLSAWKSRGFDLRDRVVISKGNNVGWSSHTWSRVRTVALTHHDSGYTETAGDPTLAAEFGRRELPVSGGGQDGDLQADALATAAMLTAASPEDTITADISSADLRAGAPQPFRDFNVADVVLMETIGGFTPVKVMSISGAEQDSGEVKFTIAGYPV